MKRDFENIVQDILTPAGITINGSQPWDIQIKDERFYQCVLSDGSLGLGESFMHGWWECRKLDDFFTRIIPSRPEDKIKKNLRLFFHAVSASAINQGRKSKAFQIGERHYDIGNDLFKNMLDIGEERTRGRCRLCHQIAIEGSLNAYGCHYVN